MTIPNLANFVGAVATTGMGLLGLFAPETCSRLVGLKARRPAGFAEFRATFGGLFLALGLTPILTQDSLCFLVSGLAWLGAAAGRTISIVADRSADRDNLIAFTIEITFAVLLLSDNPIVYGRLG